MITSIGRIAIRINDLSIKAAYYATGYCCMIRIKVKPCNIKKNPCIKRFLFNNQTEKLLFLQLLLFRKRIPSHAIDLASTGAGAWVNGHSAVLVFGECNHITNRRCPVIA